MRLLIFLCACWTCLSAVAETPSTCTTLTASANTEYPPYSWRSQADPNLLTGAMPLLVRRIGHELDIDIRVIYVGAWARAQAELASGHIDLLAGAFYTQARTQKMDYLYPALTVTQSVIWENTANRFEFTALEDLKNYQGATIINNSLGQKFDSYAPQLKLFEVASIEQAFLMLADRRVDYVAYEKEPSQYHIAKLKLTNIEAEPIALSHEPLYLTISKNSPCNTPELRKKLSAVLQQAEREGWARQYLSQAQSSHFSD